MSEHLTWPDAFAIVGSIAALCFLIGYAIKNI